MKHLSHFSSDAILKNEVIKAVYDNRVKQTKVEVFQDSRDERKWVYHCCRADKTVALTSRDIFP